MRWDGSGQADECAVIRANGSSSRNKAAAGLGLASPTVSLNIVMKSETDPARFPFWGRWKLLRARLTISKMGDVE